MTQDILVGASVPSNAAVLAFALYLGKPFRTWIHFRRSAGAIFFFDI